MNSTAFGNATAALALLVKHLGRVEGRVRLQKMLYLLKARGVEDLSKIQFRFHNYGPYSETVTDALMGGISSGMIRENARSFDEEWQRYAYEPGDLSFDPESLLSRSCVEAIEDVAERTKSLDWRVLELATIMDYLRREESLSGREATERALRLKPEQTAFAKDAERLLGDLLHS